VSAPKSKSTFDKLLSQSSMLVSELKMLRTEMVTIDPIRGSRRERSLVGDRLYCLQSRAWLISDLLREMHEAFRSTEQGVTVQSGNLRLTKGDAR